MATTITKTLFAVSLLTLVQLPVLAHQASPVAIERVGHDVLVYTLRRAADELVRVARIDPVQQGYSRYYKVKHATPRIVAKQRQALQQLAHEHQRHLVSLERQLDRELAQLSDAYQHSHHKAKPKQKSKARQAYQRKVERAYDKFAHQVEVAHNQFDKQREQILLAKYRY
ncbi:hypothetical protein LMJ53_13970 [Rheinheimera sp. UJ51]|uniref:hypothetical protein n=1 Tax=unclassified Rheinheimera TaxID=115860 RepID=UPI001E29AD30|nr:MULTISPECIES: hypothetical protein [unclassified Rheinheimera]MCC5452830.1 hypothetical protein [Rheinheimera sp. UJ51]MCF4010516.1 hypothetical protein [Rheinheimera sp. UJ63]